MRELEPETVKLLNREVFELLKPIQQRARSLVPSSPPLSNWGRSVNRPGSRPSYSPWGKRWDYGRLEWDSSRVKSQIRVSTTGVRKRGQVNRGIFSIRSNNPAGAVFEIMGRGKSSVNMVGNVRRRHGGPSPGRILYRAWDEHRSERIVEQVTSIIKRYESDFQGRLDGVKDGPA